MKYDGPAKSPSQSPSRVALLVILAFCPLPRKPVPLPSRHHALTFCNRSGIRTPDAFAAISPPTKTLAGPSPSFPPFPPQSFHRLRACCFIDPSSARPHHPRQAPAYITAENRYCWRAELPRAVGKQSLVFFRRACVASPRTTFTPRPNPLPPLLSHCTLAGVLVPSSCPCASCLHLVYPQSIG